MHFQLHKKGQEREAQDRERQEREKRKIEKGKIEREARCSSEEKVRAEDQFVTSDDSASSRSSPAALVSFYSNIEITILYHSRCLN